MAVAPTAPSQPIDPGRARLQAWYRAARPRTLTATYVPLAVSGVIALGDGNLNLLNLFRFILALVGALSLQIAANLINEYVDFARGSDAKKEAGQGMILKNAVLTPREVRDGAIITVAIGVAIGLLLTALSGTLLLWIGFGGVLVVILYTAGPLPLSYVGLGELAVFIFMGPLMVLGGYYATTGQISAQAIWAALPIAFLCAAILHANNVRDLEADRAANKRTLAVLLGRGFARAEYLFLVGAAYIALIATVAVGQVPWLTLLALVTLREARVLVQLTFQREDVPTLHAVQGRTARLHRDFGTTMVIGWLVYLVFQFLLRTL